METVEELWKKVIARQMGVYIAPESGSKKYRVNKSKKKHNGHKNTKRT